MTDSIILFYELVLLHQFLNWPVLKGVLHKLACFVRYLKIINTFSKINACILKLSKELKKVIENLVGQVIFKLGLWIRTIK